jgi:hypothetical protein
MKILTDLFSHLFLYGLITAACLFGFVFLLGGIGFILKILWVIFYPVYMVTLKPVVWGITKLFQSRCPECKGFFKKKLVDWEAADKREVRRTVNRVDQGVLYSNNLFALNQGFEINRQEQVTFVEEAFTHTWQCKDPTCGHKWKTEELQEWEGSLDQ